ncbi:periplasmic component of efflux system [Gracilibacillus boraciitolerans JCM 21714]|uniref:Periplasmic component of efflux system n=1 Tax=Gracilibacillus boraciitolerans JCM 21714 TaxID=1298598 RepID=W4VH08_9BACI|nr:hypothetical protein [Gracilibacillus boraciitolerans]GAE92426.1 periplasmic component of efflux system [Gracilibacillus boraciitolerans JCM 21714]
MKRKWVITGIGVFIAINFSLLYADDSKKIERFSLVNEWSTSETKDMENILSQEGIVMADEQYVYLDENVGSFKEFLVDKGYKVSVSDPLYSFQVKDYDETRRSINRKLTVLTEEITSLESVINQIQNYQIPTNESNDSSFTVNDGEYKIDISEDDQQYIESELQKQQFVLEKQTELEGKRTQLKSLENQLNQLETTGHTVTVTSPYQGIVRDVSVNLNDPLVTILSNNKFISAELDETEQSIVSEGMKVRIEEEWQGVVEEVHQIPERIELGDLSIFPLDVAFEDTETNEFVIGKHLDLEIILDKSEQAQAVKEEYIDKTNLWLVTEDGYLEQIKVEPGIYMSGWIELLNNLEPNTTIAYDPFERFRNHTKVTNPLKLNKINWKWETNTAKRTLMLKGIILR